MKEGGARIKKGKGGKCRINSRVFFYAARRSSKAYIQRPAPRVALLHVRSLALPPKYMHIYSQRARLSICVSMRDH